MRHSSKSPFLPQNPQEEKQQRGWEIVFYLEDPIGTRTSTSHTRGVVFPLSQRGCTYPSNHRSPTLPSLTALCHHRTRSGAKPRARCAQPAAGLSEMEMHPPNRGHGDGEAAGSAFPPPLH